MNDVDDNRTTGNEIYQDMVDCVFVKVENRNGEELIFHREDGTTFTFYHQDDCCEQVYIEDIAGDLSDLEGTPLLQAEKVSSPRCSGPNPYPSDVPEECIIDTWTWTFYKFSTIRGSVTVRWLGTSNGYYSERVDRRVNGPDGLRIYTHPYLD